jgi:flagellar hook-associated protein 2
VNAGTDSTITALGLALATPTGGTDLVGTINGIAGVAAGNRLSGASGTAAAGLSFDVGSTAGGTVTISDGVIDQLDTYLGEILGIENPLDSRISSMQKQALSIGDERAQLDRRMAALEARTRKQFNAMDALLSQLNGTGTFVAEQLANIPVPGANKK